MLPIKKTSHNLDACEAALAKLPMGIHITRSKPMNESIATIGQIIPTSVLLQNINPINASPQASKKSIVSKRPSLDSNTIQDTINDNSEQRKSRRRISAVEPSKENKRQMHRGDRQHKCDLCNKTFQRRYNLSLHKLTHEDEKPIECGFCQKEFNNIPQLQAHERHKHKNQSIGCMYCDKTFGRSSDNIAHIRAEHFDLLRKQDKLTGNLNALFQGIRTYECFKCGYSADYNNLQKHMAQCQSRYYECSFCTKKFKCRSQFRKHEDIHTRNQNDVTKRAQKVAGEASFRRNEQQTKRKSIRIADQTKPMDVSRQPVGEAKSGVPFAPQNEHKMASKRFKCDQCLEELRNENELRAHKRVHSKVIECGQCDFKCQLNIILSKHVRTMHPLGSNMEVTIDISDDDDEEEEWDMLIDV